MGKDRTHDPEDFLLRYLAARRLEGEPLEMQAADGPRFQVRTVGGIYGVFPFEDHQSPPLGMFESREKAYLAAAVFTAFGGVRWPENEEDLAQGIEVREAILGLGAMAVERAAAGRLLAGVIRHPIALELLLEAVDPAVLMEAQALASGRMVPGNREIH